MAAASITNGRRIVRIDLRGHGGSALARRERSEEEVEAALAAGPLGPESADGALAARAHALLAMDPGVVEGAIDGSTLADCDVRSPVGAPVLVLAADDAMGSALPARHAERLARTHPDVEIVRVAGAGHNIHDSRAHRDEYAEHLARFLAAHRPA